MALQPGTQYFFYTNAAGSITGGNNVPAVDLYFSFGANTSFQLATNDANFRLEGQAVPELPILALTVLGMAGLLSFTRRHGRT